MKIAVCLKQVPDRTSKFTLREDRKGIVEEGLNFEINDFDRFGLEEALKVKDKHGGEVTVVGVGPERASKALRTALGTGADRAIHVNDPRCEGSGVASVARILAAALKPGGFDLVFCGTQSEDEGSGVLGPLLAEYLGLPHVTTVMKLDVDPAAKKAVASRELEGGSLQNVELPLPAVVTVQTGLNTPRYAKLQEIMKAKKKPFEQRTLEQLSLAPDQVGPAGSATEILELAPPPERGKAQFLDGTPDQQVEKLVALLRDKEKVI